MVAELLNRNINIQLAGAPSMQVGILVNPTGGNIDTHSAQNVFGQAMLAIGQTKNGFDMAVLPFTFQSGDPKFLNLALDFNYPAGTLQQMTWAMVYQLMQTCQYFYLLSPQAPNKEIVFQVQSADGKSWGQGKMALVPAHSRRRRRRQDVQD